MPGSGHCLLGGGGQEAGRYKMQIGRRDWTIELSDNLLLKLLVSLSNSITHVFH